MIKCKRGDVVLVIFSFSEGKGSKKRPVLIMSNDSYHKSRQEVIAAAITHNIKRVLFGDTKIDEWKEAGLLYPSLVTGIIRTIKNSMIDHKLGVLSQKDFRKAQENLSKAMGF